MRKIWRSITKRLWLTTDACIVCGVKPALWVYGYEGGEARMCDWHNAEAQQLRMAAPLRHEGDS